MFLDISKPLKPAPIDKGRALALSMSMRRQSCCLTFSLMAAEFFRNPLYKGNTAKTGENSHKKSGYPQPASRGNRRHTVTLGAAFPRVWLSYHQPGNVARFKERKSGYEQRRCKTRNPAQSEDNRLFRKEQRRLVLLPILRERSRNAQDRRGQILS